MIAIMTGCPTNYEPSVPSISNISNANIADAQLKTALPPPITTPIIISIDGSFSQDQELAIGTAMLAWEDVSDGIIEFIPIWNQPKPGPLHEHYRVVEGEGIFMWYLSNKDTHHINSKLKKELENLRGRFVPGTREGLAEHSDDPNAKIVYVEKAANVIIFKDGEENEFYCTVLHELGHLLRLKHSEQINSIMYKHVSPQTCISQWDAEQLCDIYGCEPKPECYTKSKTEK